MAQVWSIGSLLTFALMAQTRALAALELGSDLAAALGIPADRARRLLALTGVLGALPAVAAGARDQERRAMTPTETDLTLGYEGRPVIDGLTLDLAEWVPQAVLTPLNLLSAFGLRADVHPDPVTGKPLIIPH